MLGADVNENRSRSCLMAYRKTAANPHSEIPMAHLHPHASNVAPWLIALLSMGGAVAAIILLALLIVWIRPDAEDRFRECMGLAESAGLLERRSEEAALICLSNATRRHGNREGPDVGFTTNGTSVLLQ